MERIVIFENKHEKLHVNETMASLLIPMLNHLDRDTRICCEKTLRVLQVAETEEQPNERDF